jgi:superfamily II DNA helicase RecQ
LGSEIERVVGFSPRAGQIQAIRKLVIDRKDLILVAPTGWGKSVVFQATPAPAAGILIVLLSPEIALSTAFRVVLIDPSFQEKLSLVAIDEAHVVSEWGQSFRVQYSQLSLLRSFIPRSVPWLACSATLDLCTLHKVKVSCGFEATVEVQRTSVDRPDIFLSIKQLMFPLIEAAPHFVCFMMCSREQRCFTVIDSSDPR